MKKIIIQLNISHFFFLFFIFSSLSATISANEYTPEGLYDIDYRHLDNGLGVILKERHQAKTVAIRIIVNTGDRDYPCDQRETPHFLEHLLFGGTSKHTEDELQQLIKTHGGSWNAYTSISDTGYELDIFSRYAGLGLATLYEMFTDSLFDADKVASTRNIIHREAGGKPSSVRQWLYKNGFGKGGVSFAVESLLAGTPLTCNEMRSTEHISRDDILRAFKQYYVPNNMTIIVVGDFDTSIIMQQLQKSFGQLPSGQKHIRKKAKLIPRGGATSYYNNLEPLVGSDESVVLLFPAVGLHAPDFYPFWVLEKYLHDRLYEIIRTEHGLAYAPEADYGFYLDVGYFFASADVDIGNADKAMALIRDEISKLSSESLKADAIEQSKRKILLDMAKGYESNAGYADYYNGAIPELQRTGTLVHEEEMIEKVTVEDIRRIANEYLTPTNELQIYSAPTLTFTQLIVLLILIATTIGWLVYHLLRRRR